jgi:hypothetical protein
MNTFSMYCGTSNETRYEPILCQSPNNGRGGASSDEYMAQLPNDNC